MITQPDTRWEKLLNEIKASKEVSSCVYKLYCGKKYLIVKGKSLAGSIYMLQVGHTAALSEGGDKWRTHKQQQEWDEKKNQYYFKFYKWINRWKEFPFIVEVILESNNHFELLKTEHELLRSTFRDKKNLNNNIDAYIPKYNEKTGNYNWMSAEDVSKFHEYLADQLKVC